MPLVNVAVQHFVVDDAIVAFADAGGDQSVLCASAIQLSGAILGDDPANHTFEWEQTEGTPVVLINPNTLFPSFVNPQVSDIEFTLYVDRGTPFETSDTVFISRRPASITRGGTTPGNAPAYTSSVTTAQSVSFSASTLGSSNVGDDVILISPKVSSYSYNYPPDETYSPIYKAEDLRRIKNNLKGYYWLMQDIDMSDLEYAWEPLGTPQQPFSGRLQGNGFSIQNLSITSGTTTAGLFAYIGNAALIEEISLTNASISGVSSGVYKGILAGSAQGPSTDDGGNVTIRNVYVEGTVDSDGDLAGGLIGHTGANASTLIENTYADVTVTGGGTDEGAFAGYFDTAATYNDNFWNSTKTAAGVGTGGDAPIAGEIDSRTTAQLEVAANYTNWDFDTVWQMPTLQDNIGPAQLQSDIYNRVVNEGRWLTTGEPQAVSWGRVTNQSVQNNVVLRQMLGVIVEDQNPSTLGWENARFFPTEHTSARMTPGRRHRLFTVIDKGQRPNTAGNTGRQPLREVAYSLPRTLVPKTPTVNAVFAGGTSRATGIVPSGAPGYTTQVITITNPKRIALSAETLTTLNINGRVGYTTDTVSRFIGGVADDEVTILFGGTGSHEGSFPSSATITRSNGGSIGN